MKTTRFDIQPWDSQRVGDAHESPDGEWCYDEDVAALEQQLASVQAQLASALAELETCKENYRNEVYECSLLQAERDELREENERYRKALERK